LSPAKGAILNREHCTGQSNSRWVLLHFLQINSFTTLPYVAALRPGTFKNALVLHDVL
jgi:hypothetical protein